MKASQGRARGASAAAAALVALLALLVVAPAADADIGLIGNLNPKASYGVSGEEGELPGVVREMQAIAVNHSGAGGVAPGEVYIGDYQGEVELEGFGGDGIFTHRWIPSPLGAQRDPMDVIADQATGNLYDIFENSVNEYSATGSFIRSFGWDVVRSGPDDSNVDTQQQLTVYATGGTYVLRTFTATGVLTTKPIPYDASAATLEAALEELSGVEVSVTGGPGDATGSSPYTIAFEGAEAGDSSSGVNVPFEGAEGLSGGTTAVRLRRIVEGGAYEICAVGDVCKRGVRETDKPIDEFDRSIGRRERVGGMFGGGFLAIAPPSAPNAGNLLLREDGEGGRIDEFSPGGTFIRSIGWDVVAHGPHDSSVDEQRKVTLGASTTGGKFSLSFLGETTGAVGNGDLVSGSTAVANVSAPNGEFVIGQKLTGGGIAAGTTIVGVGPGILTLSQAATITKLGASLTATDIDYNAPPSQVEAALNSLATVSAGGGGVSVGGAAGGPYTVTFTGALGGDSVGELTAAAGGLAVSSGEPSVTTSTVAEGGAFETCYAATDACKEAVVGKEIVFGQFRSIGGIAEDSTGALYVVDRQRFGAAINDEHRVLKLTPSGASFAVAVFGALGAPNGASVADQPVDIAIDYSDHVFVLRNFPAAATTCPATGSAAPTEQRVQEFDASGNLVDSSSPCLDIPGIGASEYSNPIETDLKVDPVSGDAYVMFYRPDPAEGLGGGEFVYVLGDAGSQPDVALSPPSGLSSQSVTISGTVNPHGPVTTNIPNPTSSRYRVEYREQGAGEWILFAPPTGIGHSTSATPFSVGVSGLNPNSPYEVRVAVSKPGFADVFSGVQTVTTKGAPPVIGPFGSDNVTTSAALIHARINPLGAQTTYHVDFGKTIGYGQSTPEGEVGGGLGLVDVETQLQGLEATGYHFRIVATNQYGTTVGPDQTFTFYPPGCPNSAVRQQTGAERLPDCRAYELVSPGSAGSATLGVGGPTSALATSPSRLAFEVYVNALGETEANPPNNPSSNYIATRTANGWKSAFVGIPADEHQGSGPDPFANFHEVALNGFEPEHQSFTGFSGEEGILYSDLGLDKTLTWAKRGFFAPGSYTSHSPFVYDALGNELGRYPTNAGTVPGGVEDIEDGGFIGAPLPSSDFSHYFFSSANVAFAAGGLTAEGGSVYDNDLATGSVTVVSKLPNGGDIPREPGDHADDFKTLPGASTDGSHVLIGATGTGVCGTSTCSQDVCPCPYNPPAHLYMRVDGSVTYDVSRGYVVRYVGMTANGSRVYFSSKQQVTSDDNDESLDIFSWSEQGDSVTRISAGAGSVGDTDNCNATWVSGCGAVQVPLNGGVFGTIPGTEASARYAGVTDNSIAAKSGDIYFYSPEQLVGSDGIPGRRNLYVSRGGQLQYVTTLDAANPIRRIQVSSDGRYAAFLTATPLTPYDNTSVSGVCSYDRTSQKNPISGPRCLEMYSYDAEAGALRCLSCPRLDPQPPTGDVRASMDGTFMTDDGRVFFTTNYPLDPQDSNGLRDVYEYVDGRAQLITSGTGALDAARALSEFGLVGVSSDGTDAYFTTFESLVPQDHNAKYMRFYDARTNGGFFVTPGLAPCVAAEECRGEGSSTLPAPAVTSSADLGAGGNVSAKPRHAKQRKKKRHHRRARHDRHRSGHHRSSPRGVGR